MIISLKEVNGVRILKKLLTTKNSSVYLVSTYLDNKLYFRSRDSRYCHSFECQFDSVKNCWKMNYLCCYWQWSLFRLSNYRHGYYSQCYFVHRHVRNVWYNKANFLIRKQYLATIANNITKNPSFRRRP